jgi:threonine dehydrogenase-like Zn-dependent dehydrogenase
MSNQRGATDPMMPAVLLTRDRRIVLDSRREPQGRPDQVIVEVDLCGICGSDRHSPDLPQVYRGGFVLGHEAAGRIAAVGEGSPARCAASRTAWDSSRRRGWSQPRPRYEASTWLAT